jgi:hypothetical protein
VPGPIEDRAIKVRMQRAKLGEGLAMLDEAAEREGAQLARQCARWAYDHRATLQAVRPKLPPELFNRAADNWRPLFAIAEAAEGDWLERMTAASIALAPDEDESLGIRLLADIRVIFEARKADKDKDDIASKDLCTALHRIETSPWAEYGKARTRITQRRLARVLEPFGITPGTVRLARVKTPKGYRRQALQDVWATYPDDDQAASATSPSRITTLAMPVA